jgi:hypothetical protein
MPFGRKADMLFETAQALFEARRNMRRTLKNISFKLEKRASLRQP